MAVLPLRRRRRVDFKRASDGSMTLIEHLGELRTRLFRASLGVLIGMGVGFYLRTWMLDLLESPYCRITRDLQLKANKGVLPPAWQCTMLQLGPTDVFVLNLKIAMWVGLIVAAPIWMYQLWAFIAPGLHRHERRWAYAFTALAAPLFALGAVLAYFVVDKGLEFLLQFSGTHVTTQLEITKYVSFITGLMLLFGVAFEFPLAIMLLNVAGVLSARRMLRMWRVAVLVFFAFSAIATPTQDPFGMTALGLALTALYFGAVGFAFVNDRRRARLRRSEYGEVGDDELSPIELDAESIGEVDSVEAASAIAPPTPVGAPTAVETRDYGDVT
jgi:sec-independent protein translocase protein TatC